ncbi:MAG TPA: ATP-binding protein [Polyangia bacterium]|jgi:two-component system NtrC family sensor kinase
MGWHRLNLKLMAAVGLASLAATIVLAALGVRTQRAQQIDEVIRGASQFSDTVRQSTRHAMIENQWPLTFHIMDAIGSQEGVRRVRVFNKEGQILFSTDRSETGGSVDKRAESCYACHAAEKPLERLPLQKRSRIFTRDGERVLGMITPIYNEPSCSEASCHAHPAGRRVLGVLDIGLSLKQVDARVAAAGRRIIAQTGALILLILTILWLFLRHFVIRPVHDLVEGTTQVARGDLDHAMPVRARDELGLLAASFNEMTAALKRTRGELAELVETLEQRVDERTAALSQAQAQALHTEKLASLGQLAASIAHEINNPLAGILTYAKLISRRLQKGTAGPEGQADMIRQLALVQRETERCSGIVKNLLGFARQREPSFDTIDANTVVREALGLVNHRLEMQSITLEKQLGDVPLVRADFDQLRQVVINIAMNAIDAMGPGGRLTVTTRHKPGATMVEVAVVDTGPGIPVENLKKIFEPFFTTKEKGTGLGLSVVYGIVSRHGGSIDVASAPGQGTTVLVAIPVAALTADAGGADRGAADAPAGRASG